jgi:cytochrome c oxidase subunit 4
MEGAVREETGARQPNYMAVFAGLAVLTAIEVGVAFMGFGRTTTILILVGLAIWKAVLVALYYMHLRFEPPRLVVMVVAPLPLALILVLAVLTEF